MSTQLARLDLRHGDRVAVADLDGEIDMSNATELGTAIMAQLGPEALGLVLDLTNVRYLDSAGIHMIYGMRERLRVRGMKLRLVVAPEALILDALRLTGVLEAVPVDEDAEQAVRAIA